MRKIYLVPDVADNVALLAAIKQQFAHGHHGCMTNMFSEAKSGSRETLFVGPHALAHTAPKLC
jgi:hypothetical protein